MGEPQQVPRHLEAAIRELERFRSPASPGVLRLDESFEHIKMRRLDAAAQPVADLPRKPPDLRDHPLEQIARKNHRGGLRRRRRGHDSITRGSTAREDTEEEEEEEEEGRGEEERWKMGRGNYGVLAARNP